MAVTKFGKVLRKLRVEHDLILKDMADSTGVSVAMLSAIELGNRKIPKGFVDRVISTYRLDGHKADELHKSAVESEQVIEFSVTDSNTEESQFLMAFAREIRNGLDKDKMQKLLKLVEES